jgi:hypothetical protein
MQVRRFSSLAEPDKAVSGGLAKLSPEDVFSTSLLEDNRIAMWQGVLQKEGYRTAMCLQVWGSRDLPKRVNLLPESMPAGADFGDPPVPERLYLLILNPSRPRVRSESIHGGDSGRCLPRCLPRGALIFDS